MLIFTADDVKNDDTLCKLDVNVKNQTTVASASLNLSRNSLKEKVLLKSRFRFENQM